MQNVGAHRHDKSEKILAASTFIPIGVALLLGVAGGFLTEIGPWYRDLRKPRLNPPNWLFGPAWTIILGLAAWSAIIAWVTFATWINWQIVRLNLRVPSAN